MAKLIDYLKQNKELSQKLGQKFIENKAHSTFLVVGQDNEQKYRFILSALQFLFCEQITSNSQVGSASKLQVPCGFCPGCLKTESQKSENFLKIVSEKNSIKVEDAHQVVQFFNLQQWGKARVVFIEDAHLMTAQAANILLKTLEEPPANSYFFLMVPSAASVLPTIRSRSQILFTRSDSNSKLSFTEDEQKCAQILISLKEKSFDILEPELKMYYSDKESALSTVKVWLSECKNQLSKDPQALRANWGEVADLCIRLELSILQNRDLGLIFDEFFIESKKLLSEI